MGYPTNTRAGGSLPLFANALFDCVFDVIGQLVATPGKELDPVIRHRVVRGRQHDAEICIELRCQPRHRGCGQNSDNRDVDAGAGKSRNNRCFQELTTGPGVTTNDR